MPYTWADGDSANATRLNGLPRGVMAYAATNTSDQTGITTLADITGLSVTFTAISTRLYKTTVNVVIQQKTTATTPSVAICDGASAVIRYGTTSLGVDEYATMSVSFLETGLSGSVTRKAMAVASVGTLSIINSTTRVGQIVTEDLGVA